MNILDMAGVNTRIYNFAQCMLPDSLRHKAIVSISDWKNEFKEECKNCILKKEDRLEITKDIWFICGSLAVFEIFCLIYKN